VPAIAPSKMNVTVYLYPSTAAAGGSGFLLGVSAPGADGHFVYAVTNRHVERSGVRSRDLGFFGSDWISSRRSERQQGCAA